MEAVFAEQLAETRRSGRGAVFRLFVRAALDIGLRNAAEMRRFDREGWMMGTRIWLDGVVADLTGAVRGFRRTPGFVLAAVATLSLGVGALTAVYSVVNGVVLTPLPYPDPDQLVVVYNEYPALDVTRARQSPGDLDDYREQADLLTDVGSVSTFPQTILESGQPRRVEVALVTPGFFSMLGVEPSPGRDIVAEDDHDVVIVSHAYWRDELGSRADALGTVLRFAGVSKRVIGVLPEGFRLVVPSSFGVPESPALWTPIPAQGWGRDSGDRTAHWMNVVGRLRPGATRAQLQEQMDAIAELQRELLPRRAEREARIQVAPLLDEIVRDVRPALVALFAAAGIVLLIACANVANLMLVRAQRRRSEIAVRTALGASHVRIVHGLLSEGLLLAAAGSFLGLALATVGVDAVLALEPDSVPRLADIALDFRVLGFVAVVTGAVTVVFSVAPAWLATRRDVVLAIRDAGRSGPTRRGHALSSSLIVAELALSLILLTGGGLLVRSFVALLDTDPGFATAGVLTFRAPLPASAFQQDPPEGYKGRPEHNFVRKPYYDELTRVLAQLPGVRSVGAIFPAPLSGEQSSSTYAVEGTTGAEEGDLASSQLVTPEYFETVGIDLLEGRTFLPEEIGDKLVIDQAMAETLWPGESAIGRRIEIGWWSGPIWGEVVGVVENVRTHSLREPNPLTVYRLGTVYAYSAMTMAMRVDGDPLALVDEVRAAVAQVEGEAPVIDIRLMSEYVDDQSARTRFVLALVGVFAALALGLAAIGLYGVIAYAVGQRTREYGIRLAFGAGRARVFRLVLRRGARLTGAGLALGVLGAFGMRHLVQPFLFGVEPTDPVTIVAMAALLGLVALVACSAPAGRATLVDPADSLRSE